MTNKRFLFWAAGILVAITACETVDMAQQYGELSVNLSSDNILDVTTKAPVVLEQDSDDAALYTVRIYNSSDVLQYEETYDEFEPQRLPLGTYYVTVEDCSPAEAEVDNGIMRLYGRSSDIVLSVENLSQTASVACAVANAKVSVAFDSSVQDRFQDLQVVISGGTTEGRTLTIPQTAPEVETVTWFNPSTLTYNISGTFVSSGLNKQVTLTNKITVAPKDNIRLLVKVNLDNGQLLSSVTVDKSISGQETVEGEFFPYM